MKFHRGLHLVPVSSPAGDTPAQPLSQTLTRSNTHPSLYIFFPIQCFIFGAKSHDFHVHSRAHGSVARPFAVQCYQALDITAFGIGALLWSRDPSVSTLR